MVPGPGASALLENLSEMHILGPHTNTLILVLGPSICFNKPPVILVHAGVWEPLYCLILSQGEISIKQFKARHLWKSILCAITMLLSVIGYNFFFQRIYYLKLCINIRCKEGPRAKNLFATNALTGTYEERTTASPACYILLRKTCKAGQVWGDKGHILAQP